MHSFPLCVFVHRCVYVCVCVYACMYADAYTGFIQECKHIHILQTKKELMRLALQCFPSTSVYVFTYANIFTRTFMCNGLKRAKHTANHCHFVHPCTYTCMYTSIHVHTCMGAYGVYIYIYIHIYIHIYIYIRRCASIYVHLYMVCSY